MKNNNNIKINIIKFINILKCLIKLSLVITITQEVL